jgi:hypothetical protein
MTERNPVEIKTETIINNDPGIIWDYATLPENWMKAMPENHFVLEYENGIIEAGRKLHVKENIGAFPTDTRAVFLYVRRPEIVVWTGRANIRLFDGVIKCSFHVSQVVTFDQNEKGVKVRNSLYIYFPETYFGKIMHWIFSEVIHGERIFQNHLDTETFYFKEKLDLG